MKYIKKDGKCIMKKVINKIKETIILITISVASSFILFDLVSSLWGAEIGIIVLTITLFSVFFKLSEQKIRHNKNIFKRMVMHYEKSNKQNKGINNIFNYKRSFKLFNI